MAIMRWNPARDLEEMNERISRAFGHWMSRPGESNRESMMMPDWAPPVDIAETENEYLVTAELPEVRKEDVHVVVENGVLRIEGERRQTDEEKSRRFHRVERSYGYFLRTFTLPDNVDESQVGADFKDGVLKVHLPKTEQARRKSVEVRVG